MLSVLVINGPNLNLLGSREPEVYGADTLDDIALRLTQQASKHDIRINFMQSNHEGEILDAIHQSRDSVDHIIINPGAFTHTSVALRDALLGCAIPFIEVHISNTHKREAFRHHSYLSDIAEGVILGLGTVGYELALSAIIHTKKL